MLSSNMPNLVYIGKNNMTARLKILVWILLAAYLTMGAQCVSTHPVKKKKHYKSAAHHSGKSKLSSRSIKQKSLQPAYIPELFPDSTPIELHLEPTGGVYKIYIESKPPTPPAAPAPKPTPKPKPKEAF